MWMLIKELRCDLPAKEGTLVVRRLMAHGVSKVPATTVDLKKRLEAKLKNNCLMIASGIALVATMLALPVAYRARPAARSSGDVGVSAALEVQVDQVDP
jgi:hypothetical protein